MRTLVASLTCFTLALALQAQTPSAKFAGHWVADDSLRQIPRSPNTMSEAGMARLKDLGNGRWEDIQRDAAGKIRVINYFDVAEEGNAMTVVGDSLWTDPPVRQTATYKRVSGEGRTVLGSWMMSTVKRSRPIAMAFEVAQEGLNVTIGPDHFVMAFDGKPMPMTGLRTVPGRTMTAHLLNETTIEEIEVGSNGAGTRHVWSLSADGRTLTDTTTPVRPVGSAAPPAEPAVEVYRRQ